MLSALVPLVWLFGFTVDDALITARVAHQLALGNGYRFNANGPIVDAVTPLGFAFLLLPAAGSGPLSALAFAKWLGAAAWLAAAGIIGWEVGHCGRRSGATALAVLLVCTPLACWAAAGMETGLVTLLATLSLGRARVWPLFAGLAAALRPELGAWAVVLTLGRALFDGSTMSSRGRPRALAVLGALAAGIGPLVLVAITRSLVFGQAYPLSVLAKPSTPAQGVAYALSALVHTGPAWLLLAAPAAYRSLSRRSRVALIAVLAHFVALVLVGGDWMPLYRLAVPVLPALIVAGAELSSAPTLRWTAPLRLVGALAVSLHLAARLGPSAAAVGEQRAALIRGGRAALSGASCVGSLDVGWVGAATSARVVDFAGVTDPTVARLPGGHTTKRLPAGFLQSRGVDALVVLAHRPSAVALGELNAVRAVESRLAALEGAADFRPVAVLPLLGTEQGYVVYRRSKPSG